MKNILIFVPHMPFIFTWILANNLKLVSFFKDISSLNYNIILKFHPRHSKVELYKTFLNLENFQIEEGENTDELIELSDLIIAFETSAVLFDVIFKNKPLVYIKDYIPLFNNETVYIEFLEYLTLLSFDELYSFLKEGLFNEDFDNFLPKITKNQLLYCFSEEALSITEENLKKIIWSIFFNNIDSHTSLTIIKHTH